MSSGKLTIWLSAIRPKTLGLSISPVLVGTCLAWWQAGEIHGVPAMAALLVAMLIQIGTNLHNDAADALSGTDTEERLGPLRVTAQGLLSAKTVQRASLMAFVWAFVLGIYLAWVGGWPIVLLGLLSLLAGASYSGGPWPISASPLGELFVFVFFGLVATGGSYFLQTGQFTGVSMVAGSMLGCFAAAVLAVNNYRDRVTDRKSGRRTLAVLITPAASRVEYGILLILPFLILLLMYPVFGLPGLSLLPLLLFPVAAYLFLKITRLVVDSSLNLLLAHTARLQLVFSLLFCLGLSV